MIDKHSTNNCSSCVYVCACQCMYKPEAGVRYILQSHSNFIDKPGAQLFCKTRRQSSFRKPLISTSLVLTAMHGFYKSARKHTPGFTSARLALTYRTTSLSHHFCLILFKFCCCCFDILKQSFSVAMEAVLELTLQKRLASASQVLRLKLYAITARLFLILLNDCMSYYEYSGFYGSNT